MVLLVKEYYVYAHNPFHKVMKSQKKKKTHRRPSHAQRYLLAHFVTRVSKFS